MEYIILAEVVDYYPDLEVKVNIFIKNGWEPLGGVSAYKNEKRDKNNNPIGRIFQAMIKKTIQELPIDEPNTNIEAPENITI